MWHQCDIIGHVIIRYLVSYRSSIDTNPLSWAVCEILSLVKHIWVATLTFRVTWCHQSHDCSIGHGLFPIRVPLVLTITPKDFEILMLSCIWVMVLTFLGHVMSSVTWPFDWPWAISYRCSIGTDSLSPRDFEILRLKCIWVTVLTFLGHVSSSVTWSLFQPYVVSYRWSVDTLS